MIIPYLSQRSFTVDRWDFFNSVFRSILTRISVDNFHTPDIPSTSSPDSPSTSTPDSPSSRNTGVQHSPVRSKTSLRSLATDPSTRRSAPSRSPVTRSKTRGNPSTSTAVRFLLHVSTAVGRSSYRVIGDVSLSDGMKGDWGFYIIVTHKMSMCGLKTFATATLRPADFGIYQKSKLLKTQASHEQRIYSTRPRRLFIPCK